MMMPVWRRGGRQGGGNTKFLYKLKGDGDAGVVFAAGQAM